MNIYNSCGLALVSVHLKTWMPLPVFTDWLWQSKSFTCQPVQRFWVGSLVVSMSTLASQILGRPGVGVGLKPGTMVLSLVLVPTRTLASEVPHWS